jgi:hypothetical protein
VTGLTINSLYPGIAVLPTSNTVVVVDNNTIKFVTNPGGVVTTKAGTAGTGVSPGVDGIGTAATFYQANDVSVNPATGVIYVSDFADGSVRAITPT